MRLHYCGYCGKPYPEVARKENHERNCPKRPRIRIGHAQ